MTRISVKSAIGAVGLPVSMPCQGPIGADFGDVDKRYWATFHKGVDIKVRVGTDVKCVWPGVIQISGWHKNFGHRIWVLSEHPVLGKFRHLYAHNTVLYRDAGHRVEVGQIITISGDTGETITGKRIGAHLHFQLELWPSRVPIRPIFI